MKKITPLLALCLLISGCLDLSEDDEPKQNGKSESHLSQTLDSSDNKSNDSELVGLSKRQLNVMKSLIEDDVKTYTRNGKNIFNYLNDVPQVTAIKLSKDYDENEIAADEKYLDKKVLVEGKVTGIQKEFITDDPFVSLQGADLFMEVHASFDADHQDELAKLKKGTKASFVCVGKGVILSSPMLEQCESFESAALAGAENIISSASNIAKKGIASTPDSEEKEQLKNILKASILAESLLNEEECTEVGAECIKAAERSLLLLLAEPEKQSQKVKDSLISMGFKEDELDLNSSKKAKKK